MTQPLAAAVLPADLIESLDRIYSSRPDLQACFRPDDWTAIPSVRTSGIVDLEDWAGKYGYIEYPAVLAGFAPAAAGSDQARTAARLPPALVARSLSYMPELKAGARFDFNRLSASAVLVVDYNSREILLARNSRTSHPIASITKLMTAMVLLDRNAQLRGAVTMTADETARAGEASLKVRVSEKLTSVDLFYAMIVGSANNAAHALARSSGLTIPEFVAAMNRKAAALGLRSSVFADPTGLETDNISTPVDTAALAIEAFDRYYLIRKAATTSTYDLVVAGQKHQLKNTNELLTDEDNGLIVLGGKTGYLNESKWNLVTKIRDGANRPLVVVVFGSDTQQQLFNEAETAARWVWQNYRWVKVK
ncbi:MAG: serine hydrolase [Patescibacteria group bacterium]